MHIVECPFVYLPLEETVYDTCLVMVLKIHFNYPKRKRASITKVIRLRKS